MLDFYLIQDDQSTPDSPEELGLKYVGGIEFEPYKSIQRKGVLEERFQYYSDFRWSSQFISNLIVSINSKNYQSDTDVKLLMEILEDAKMENHGLVAYCD